MPNAQVRRRGAYAPLAATYFTDDDVMEAGEEAELLYVRGLAFCAGSPASDGYITDKQVARVIGAGMPELAERIQALVSVGLWERLPGGYAVRSWLKWNKSAEELGRHRARDRDRKSAGGHPERGSGDDAEPEPEGEPEPEEFPEVSTDVPRGICMESDPVSSQSVIRIPATGDLDSVPLTQHNTTQHDSQKDSPSSPAAPATDGQLAIYEDAVEGEITADLPNQRRASSWDNVDLNVDPDFRAFWDAYPRKVDKGHARKTWISLMKKGGIEPADIIAGAIAFRNDPERSDDIKFTPHPATWLNGERWTDYDEADVVPVSNSDEWWNN